MRTLLYIKKYDVFLLSDELRFDDIELVFEYKDIEALSIFPSNFHAGDPEKSLVLRPSHFNVSSNSTTNMNRITMIIHSKVSDTDPNCVSWVPSDISKVRCCPDRYSSQYSLLSKVE